MRPALRSTAVHVTIGPRTGRGTQEVRGRTGEPGETGAYAFHRELNLHGLLPYGPGTHGGRGGAHCAAPPWYARRTGYRGTPPTRVPRPGTQRGQVRRRAADPPRAASKRVRPRERTTSRTVRIGSRDSGGFSCARVRRGGGGSATRARRRTRVSAFATTCWLKNVSEATRAAERGARDARRAASPTARRRRRPPRRAGVACATRCAGSWLLCTRALHAAATRRHTSLTRGARDAWTVRLASVWRRFLLIGDPTHLPHTHPRAGLWSLVLFGAGWWRPSGDSKRRYQSRSLYGGSPGAVAPTPAGIVEARRFTAAQPLGHLGRHHELGHVVQLCDLLGSTLVRGLARGLAF